MLNSILEQIMLTADLAFFYHFAFPLMIDGGYYLILSYCCCCCDFDFIVDSVVEFDFSILHQLVVILFCKIHDLIPNNYYQLMVAAIELEFINFIKIIYYHKACTIVIGKDHNRIISRRMHFTILASSSSRSLPMRI